jgi:hypothetical protein
MPLMDVFRTLADLVVKLIRAIVQIVSRFFVGLRWLVKLAVRLRSQGAYGVLPAGTGTSGGSVGQGRVPAGGPALARLFDVHAVTVAADFSLIAGLIWAPGAPDGLSRLLSGVAMLMATGLAVWLVRAMPGAVRATIGFGLVLRGILTLLVAQWLVGNWTLLLILTALVVPQWVLHGGALRRLMVTDAPAVVPGDFDLPAGAGAKGSANRPIPADPAARAAQRAASRQRVTVQRLAMSYAMICGLLTGVTSLLVGAFAPAWPLWVTGLLLALGALLAVRLPGTSGGQPRARRPRSRPTDTASPDKRNAPTVPFRPTVPNQPTDRDVPISPKPTGSAPPEGFHVYRPSSLDDSARREDGKT